ncbi:MAG: 50S ribosomal protein L24 [Firmicutes bacterium]|jgi:ribosomal protein L24|nr:50S ribosomal protein L24 [Bacillota bacterium]
MKVKKNDTVLVIAGKDSGKTAKVVEARPQSNTVVVEGINIQKRHTKPRNAQDVGGIKDKLGAIDASNVMVVCPACNKAVRVSYQIEGDKKIRVCKKCGKPLDATKEAKEVKKAAAKKKTKKAADAE